LTEGYDLYGSKDLSEVLEDEREAATTPPADERRNDPHPFENLTIHDLMVRMRRGLVEDLLDRLESKTATHQELAIIQRMLNDAGYVVDRDPTNDPAEGVSAPRKADLPSFDGQDYDQ